MKWSRYKRNYTARTVNSTSNRHGSSVPHTAANSPSVSKKRAKPTMRERSRSCGSR